MSMKKSVLVNQFMLYHHCRIFITVLSFSIGRWHCWSGKKREKISRPPDWVVFKVTSDKMKQSISDSEPTDLLRKEREKIIPKKGKEDGSTS